MIEGSLYQTMDSIGQTYSVVEISVQVHMKYEKY